MRKWKCVLLNCDVSKKPSFRYTLLLDLLSDSPAWIKVPLPQQSSGPLAPYCPILSLLLLRLYCSYMKHLPGRSECQDCSPVQDFTPVFSIGANLFSHLVTVYLPFSLWGNGPSLSTVYSWHLAQCIRHSEHSKCWSCKFIKIKLAYAFKYYFHKDMNLSFCVPTISECTTMYECMHIGGTYEPCDRRSVIKVYGLGQNRVSDYVQTARRNELQTPQTFDSERQDTLSHLTRATE